MKNIDFQKLKTKMFGYFDLNGYLIPLSLIHI